MTLFAASANNREVSHRLVAGVLVCVVHLSAITAPLTHIHLADYDTDHHHPLETHAHLSAHPHAVPATPAPGHTPALDHRDDDRVVRASLFLVVHPDVMQITMALPVATVVIVPDRSPISGVPQVSHGPDPPSRNAASPRAPPSFPSLI